MDKASGNWKLPFSKSKAPQPASNSRVLKTAPTSFKPKTIKRIGRPLGKEQPTELMLKRQKYLDFFKKTIFYLDISVNKDRERRFISQAITRLGGVVEPFFSKKVKCVVTSLPYETIKRFETSTDPENSGKHCPSPQASLNSTATNNTVSVMTDRARSFLKPLETNATKAQPAATGTSLLQQAKYLNIRVVSLDQIIVTLQKYLNIRMDTSKSDVGELNALASSFAEFKFPYILIEDAHEKHRPIHKEFTKDDSLVYYPLPFLSLNSGPGGCPFYHAIEKEKPVEEKEKPKSLIATLKQVTNEKTHELFPLPKETKISEEERLKLTNEKIKIAETLLKNSEEKTAKVNALRTAHVDMIAEELIGNDEVCKKDKKPGYCECCMLKYSDFEAHVHSKVHRGFAANDSNFDELDMLLEDLSRKPHVFSEEMLVFQGEEYERMRDGRFVKKDVPVEQESKQEEDKVQTDISEELIEVGHQPHNPFYSSKLQVLENDRVESGADMFHTDQTKLLTSHQGNTAKRRMIKIVLKSPNSPRTPLFPLSKKRKLSQRQQSSQAKRIPYRRSSSQLTPKLPRVYLDVNSGSLK